MPDPERSDHARTHLLLRPWVGPVLAAVLLLGAGFYAVGRSRARMRVGGYVRLTHDGRSKDVRTTPATIVTNGGDLYFTETENEHNVLARISTRGGEVSYGPAPSQSAHLIGWQPDARSLLFGSYWDTPEAHPLLSLDPGTGKSAPVHGITAQDADWSPDGKELAYAQRGKVFVLRAGGSTDLIASVGGQAYWIRWSPDGHIIRFSENYEGFHDRLWEVDHTGGNLHLLLANQNDNDHVCCGSWTKSGKAFVYLSVQADSNSIHIRAEDQTRWGRWAEANVSIPAAPLDKWTAAIPSVDGKHVFAIGEQLRGQLISIDPLTRQARPVLTGLSAEGVNFSPDGKEIAWTAYPEGTLWRSRSDGSGRMQLTRTPLLARFPHWSPDGATIVFTAARPGANWQLYRVPAQGGEVLPLLPEANGQGVPTWSPDGRQIAFGHTTNATLTQTPFFVEVFRLGDQKASRLPGSEGLWTPRWSPDGRFLSAVTTDDRTLRLYDFETKTWRDLAHGSVNDVVWSPDSESLFFDSDASAKPVLYRLRLRENKQERWASLENVKRAGFFAPWLGISPEGFPPYARGREYPGALLNRSESALAATQAGPPFLKTSSSHV